MLSLPAPRFVVLLLCLGMVLLSGCSRQTIREPSRSDKSSLLKQIKKEGIAVLLDVCVQTPGRRVFEDQNLPLADAMAKGFSAAFVKHGYLVKRAHAVTLCAEYGYEAPKPLKKKQIPWAMVERRVGEEDKIVYKPVQVFSDNCARKFSEEHMPRPLVPSLESAVFAPNLRELIIQLSQSVDQPLTAAPGGLYGGLSFPNISDWRSSPELRRYLGTRFLLVGSLQATVDNPTCGVAEFVADALIKVIVAAAGGDTNGTGRPQVLRYALLDMDQNKVVWMHKDGPADIGPKDYNANQVWEELPFFETPCGSLWPPSLNRPACE